MRVLPLLILLPALALPAQEAKEPFFKPFDQNAYVAHARTLGATDAQLATFTKEKEELGIGRAADNLARALSPALDAAVKLRLENDPRAALEITKVLAATEDKLLQAHIRYHLGGTMLENDDPEHTVKVFEDYLRQNSNLTPLDDEIVYYYAQALAEIPFTEDAIKIFRAYLGWFPNASERHRATATQRLFELARQNDSDLHKLADGMKKVGRDLKYYETGKPTQETQKDFILKLDELIELYEQMEKQSSGAPSGNGPSQAPADRSALPEGESTVGAQNAVKKAADRWGNMKDKEREQIESEVNANLPPEYRKMLTEYYKRLGSGGAK